MLTIYLWKPGKRLLRLDTINQYTIRDWWIQENKRAKWFSSKIKKLQTLVRQFSEGPCREGWSQWKREKRQKKAKRRKMSKLSQVSLKDTVEKDGHSGQEKRQKYKTKRLFKLSQVSFRKDTAERGDTLDVAAALSYLSRYLRISAVLIHIIKRMTVKAYLRRVA